MWLYEEGQSRMSVVQEAQSRMDVLQQHQDGCATEKGNEEYMGLEKEAQSNRMCYSHSLGIAKLTLMVFANALPDLRS